MKTRRTFTVLALLLVAPLVFATVALAQDKTFTVGVPLPLTGAEAKFGEMEKQAYEMAIAEVNTKGGVKGMKLALDIQDSGGKPETASAMDRAAISPCPRESPPPRSAAGRSSSRGRSG
jgi:branched-chain amino acid transport system substrate-binding protein